LRTGFPGSYRAHSSRPLRWGKGAFLLSRCGDLSALHDRHFASRHSAIHSLGSAAGSGRGRRRKTRAVPADHQGSCAIGRGSTPGHWRASSAPRRRSWCTVGRRAPAPADTFERAHKDAGSARARTAWTVLRCAAGGAGSEGVRAPRAPLDPRGSQGAHCCLRVFRRADQSAARPGTPGWSHVWAV
jgi:hypothetical protein